MSTTDELKTVPVSECSSDMFMNGFESISLWSINEDAEAQNVRNGSIPFCALLLTYILNQASWHFVYLSIAGSSFNVS